MEIAALAGVDPLKRTCPPRPSKDRKATSKTPPGGSRESELSGIPFNSDAGSQYTSIRYTDRLIEAGLHASIGTVGDSYDDALAESVNGLYKAELVYWEGPWRGAGDLELATLGWVDWFNHTRIHSFLSYRTPAEIEDEYYRHNHTVEQPLAAELTV